MASTTILDADLNKASPELSAAQSMDLTTDAARDNPNAETTAGMAEFFEMKAHPEAYKRHSSFQDAMNEALTELAL